VPLDFGLRDTLQPVATDADGSESPAREEITVQRLSDGTLVSTNNGASFSAVQGGPQFEVTVDGIGAYENVVVHLHPKFSTQSPPGTITGSVTFFTHEALLAGDKDPSLMDGDGVARRGFTVNFTAEADVVITAEDVRVI
jgi:hypothetical protein